jgi:hypothetical protein
MSADNGIIITRHPLGGYALVDYFASSDKVPAATVEHESYKCIGDAMVEVGRRMENGACYEYGVSISSDIL